MKNGGLWMKMLSLALPFTVFSIFVLSLIVSPAQSVTVHASLTVSSQVVPSTIGPGESGNLVLTISNGGTEYARSVKLAVSPHTYITFSRSSYDLGTIAPSGSTQIIVPITLSPTIEGYATSVFFSVSYTEGDSVGTVTIDASASVSISRRSLVEIEDVIMDKELIEPGDVVDVIVRVKNVGLGTLKDMSVEFGNATLPFVAVGGDAEAYLGDLIAKGTKAAEFSIIVTKDAKTTAYRTPLTIRYYDDSGVLHTDVKYIGLKVSGSPEFIVTLEDDSKMYAGYAGAEGKLTLSIANRGTATANFLTLRFSSSDPNFYMPQKEYYAGNLDPDDSQTVTVAADLSAANVGKNSLSIELAYKDPYNQELSKSASVDFIVRAAPPFSLSPMTMLAIVGVVAVILYWKRKFFIGLFRRNKIK